MRGLLTSDTAKSGFVLRKPGRTVNPAVREAVKMIAKSKIHSGTGLEYLEVVVNRVIAYCVGQANEP